ncbi:MAG TPA: SRPBCC domain-containing protein [Nitrososphaera sp.]|nr:SRPBCC domain-containing protein [Nitrososphaera sp.]
MRELHTEIEINANPETVWRIITDFENYREWNPFIRRIVGQAKQGSKIEVHIRTPAGKKRKYAPTITRVDVGHELRWIGKGWLLNGEHIFTIERLQEGNKVRFVHREVFGGPLSGFFGTSLDTDIRKGFEEMNKALKERAELSNP